MCFLIFVQITENFDCIVDVCVCVQSNGLVNGRRINFWKIFLIDQYDEQFSMMDQVLNPYVSSMYPLLEVTELYHQFPRKRSIEVCFVFSKRFVFKYFLKKTCSECVERWINSSNETRDFIWGISFRTPR